MDTQVFIAGIQITKSGPWGPDTTWKATAKKFTDTIQTWYCFLVDLNFFE